MIKYEKFYKSTFENCEIHIPDKEILVEFENKVKPLFAEILFLSEMNRELSKLRDTLLPKLMSDDVDISALEI